MCFLFFLSLFSSCFDLVDDKEQAALHPHSKGNIVGKIVPFTGVLCHGGYCDFKERAKVSVCSSFLLFLFVLVVLLAPFWFVYIFS